MILLRIGKRRESYANRDVSEVLLSEFLLGGKPDLAISVYEIEDRLDCIVQTDAEHAASAGLSPRTARHMDVSRLHERGPTPVPAGGKFQRLNAVHRELRFASDHEQLAFIARLVASYEDRARETQKAALKEYAIGRVSSGDQEWIDAMKSCGKAATWLGSALAKTL